MHRELILKIFFFRSRLLGSSDIESDSDNDVRPPKRLIGSDDEDDKGEERPRNDPRSSADDSDDSRSRGGRSSDENDFGPSRESDVAKGKAKKAENRQSRKSKEAALKEIYSESSRMLRESKVKHFCFNKFLIQTII
jgi:hypothetical protein